MSCYEVRRSQPLSGVINIQGSKNSVLPIMAGAILADGVTILENCPDISDVQNTILILRTLGCRVEKKDSTVYIDTANLNRCIIQDEYSEKMRSSFIFMGALLARFKKAVMAMPGGCNIGLRPIDIHLKAFEKMGVVIREDKSIYADGSNLLDAYISLEFPSVGATENVIMLAVLSERTIVIDNAAREPEIVELCDFLRKMGADINGSGSSRIIIKGVRKLHCVNHRIGGDRICAGTYIAAVGMCGGSIKITGIDYNLIDGTRQVLSSMGIQINDSGEGIDVTCNGKTNNIDLVETKPHPGFPTDMQSQIMSMACVSNGNMRIKETMFENRFRTVPELIKMKADIAVSKNSVYIKGNKRLKGCDVTAYELRGGAALVLAGLAADGVTNVHGIKYIKRGYENIVRDLQILGADIRLV